MTAQLRTDALAIWQAGVEAVRSDRLVQQNMQVEDDWLVFSGGGGLNAGEPSKVRLSSIGRIAVVGAGKAGAGMAAGLEAALGARVLAEKHVRGWVNVPADCVRPLEIIRLHAARPAGVNEPTLEGVAGAEQILNMVSSLEESDLCICLLSGGGSALLPAPVEGVSLADKQAVTRCLSASGANIQELNTVRKQLSRIKGGGLARACRAGRLVTLIISDVLGDPLDVIASGPTVPNSTTAADALAILERYGCASPALRDALRRSPIISNDALCPTTNLIIGNNAVAVSAAGIEAQRHGYRPTLAPASSLEGAAEEVGRQHVQALLRMMQSGGGCLISGGEPTVKLAAAEVRGKGGRNQQLVLAALSELISHGRGARPGLVPSTQYSVLGAANASALAAIDFSFCLLSGGTDGEDGPTDAAGAVIDEDFIARAQGLGLDPNDFLFRNDAYTFFESLGGLIKTGPTHTNVCDVRVVLAARR